MLLTEEVKHGLVVFIAARKHLSEQLEVVLFKLLTDTRVSTESRLPPASASSLEHKIPVNEVTELVEKFRDEVMTDLHLMLPLVGKEVVDEVDMRRFKVKLSSELDAVEVVVSYEEIEQHPLTKMLQDNQASSTNTVNSNPSPPLTVGKVISAIQGLTNSYIISTIGTGVMHVKTNKPLNLGDPVEAVDLDKP